MMLDTVLSFRDVCPDIYEISQDRLVFLGSLIGSSALSKTSAKFEMFSLFRKRPCLGDCWSWLNALPSRTMIVKPWKVRETKPSLLFERLAAESPSTRATKEQPCFFSTEVGCGYPNRQRCMHLVNHVTGQCDFTFSSYTLVFTYLLDFWFILNFDIATNKISCWNVRGYLMK